MASTLRRYTEAELLEQQGRGTCVVDVRSAEQYASFHLQGALQIGVDGPLASWAGILIHPEQTILLIAESIATVEEACTRLQRVGLHRVIGYVLADEQRWREELLEVRSLRIRRSVEIPLGTPIPLSAELVDVRSKAEWLQGHVPGSRCVPLLELALGTAEGTSFERVLVYCNEGFRAMIAASIFRQSGDAEVEVLIDGIGGWTDAGFPLIAGEAGRAMENASNRLSDRGKGVTGPEAVTETHHGLAPEPTHPHVGHEG